MKISYNSPVILTFALICASVLLIDMIFNQALTNSLFVCYPHMKFTNPLSYFRLFSHVIGHKDWSHLISNFTLILLIGPILEEKYGSKRIIIMILVAAGITGILNTLLFPTGLLGASGIVFMFIILGSFTNFKSGDIPLTFILVVLLFLSKEVIDAFRHDNISQFAHIAGGVFGSIFGFKSVKS